jgi:hypothetical protein
MHRLCTLNEGWGTADRGCRLFFHCFPMWMRFSHASLAVTKFTEGDKPCQTSSN